MEEVNVIKVNSSQKGLTGYYFQQGRSLLTHTVLMGVLYWGLFYLIGTITYSVGHGEWNSATGAYEYSQVQASTLSELWKYGIADSRIGGPQYLIIPLFIFFGMIGAGIAIIADIKEILDGIQLVKTHVTINFATGKFWKMTYGWFGKYIQQQIDFDSIPEISLQKNSWFDQVNNTGTLVLTLHTYVKGGYETNEVTLPYIENPLNTQQQIGYKIGKRQINLGVDIKSMPSDKKES